MLLGCAGTHTSTDNSAAYRVDLMQFETRSTIFFDNILIPVETLPEGYQTSTQLMCKSIQPATFYENPNTYAALIGTCTSKQHISYVGPNDKGTIIYLEYAGGVTGAASSFLGGLIWGQPGKPTTSHPEEIFFAKNAIVIWSFDQASTAKNLSQLALHNYLNGTHN